MKRRWGVGTAVAIMAAPVAACTATAALAGVGGAPHAEPTTAAPDDLRFLAEMIMHHQGAVVPARGMIDDSARPDLRDLARGIVDGQQRQVEQMQGQRRRWHPGAGPDPMGGKLGGA